MNRPFVSSALPPTDWSAWRKVRPVLLQYGVLLLICLLMIVLHLGSQFFLSELFLLSGVFALGYLLMGLVNQYDRTLKGLAARLPAPVQGWIIHHRLHRVLAIMMVYLLMALVGTLVVLKLGPLLQHQLISLQHDWPTYTRQWTLWGKQVAGAGPLKSLLAQWGTQLNLDLSKDSVVQWIAPLRSLLVTNLLQASAGTLKLLLYSLSSLVMLFYILLDGDRLKKQALALLPDRWQPGVGQFVTTFHVIASEFVVGQMALAVLGALWMALVYNALHLPYISLLTAVFVLASLVPIIGVWLGALPGLLILVVRGSLLDVISLFALLTLLAWFRVLWLHPLLFTHRRYFHPVMAIVVLLVALQEGGLWGVLFYYPMATLLATINWLYGPHRHLTRPARSAG